MPKTDCNYYETNHIYDEYHPNNFGPEALAN